MLFKDIETDRLFLKNISLEDREFVYSQFSDAVVTKYLYDEEPLTDLSGADQIIDSYLEYKDRQNRWIIIRKLDGAKMGTCGFHCWNKNENKVEIGYDLQEEFWGNGYMQEALKAAFQFAFDHMQMKEIVACISVDNHRSIHLAEKLGFVETDTYYEAFRGDKYLHRKYTLYLDK